MSSSSTTTTPSTKSAGIAEGPVRNICYEHKFEAPNSDAYEDHMIKEEHYALNGNTNCGYCKETVHYDKLRYRGKDKGVGAVCEECAKEMGFPANARRIALEDTNKPDTLSDDSKKRLSAARNPTPKKEEAAPKK